MKPKINEKSQSILEYAILISVIIASLVAMQVFIKRGYSGRLKASSDSLGGGGLFSPGSTTQKQDTRLLRNQFVYQETATKEGKGIDYAVSDLRSSAHPGSELYEFLDDLGNVNYIMEEDQGRAYSATWRWGGRAQSTAGTMTAGAGDEDFRSSEYDAYNQDLGDFNEAGSDLSLYGGVFSQPVISPVAGGVAARPDKKDEEAGGVAGRTEP